MKISKRDFNTLTTIVEFHFKFSEYIRETDEELYYRAIDYGKTFAVVEGESLLYWHEDNKKFLEELNMILSAKKEAFENYLSLEDDIEEATKSWVIARKANPKDPMGMGKYLSNFIRHSKELDFDSFDDDDWNNFITVCGHVKNSDKFIQFAKSQIIRVNGNDSPLLKGFTDDTTS